MEKILTYATHNTFLEVENICAFKKVIFMLHNDNRHGYSLSISTASFLISIIDCSSVVGPVPTSIPFIQSVNSIRTRQSVLYSF